MATHLSIGFCLNFIPIRNEEGPLLRLARANRGAAHDCGVIRQSPDPGYWRARTRGAPARYVAWEIVSPMRVAVGLKRVDLQVYWGASSRSGPALGICCRAASWVDPHHRHSPAPRPSMSESSCTHMCRGQPGWRPRAHCAGFVRPYGTRPASCGSLMEAGLMASLNFDLDLTTSAYILEI